MIRVDEKNFQEVKARFDSLSSDLMKMEYLESVLKINEFGMDVRKFVFSNLGEIYAKRLMYDKAAKVYYSKAGFDSTFRERIDSFMKAGEYFARAGNLISAEDMFARASREANAEQKKAVDLGKIKIFVAIAEEFEKKSRMTNAVKFYEELLKMKVSDLDKQKIKAKLLDYYTRMGKFTDAKLVQSK
jgi:tetratricopeptide (TPR) repeat protein